MGDVAVTPNPTADQLAQIAYTTAQTAKTIVGIEEPHVAMLSYSTKGSAKDAIDKTTGKSVYVIDKVIDAVKIALRSSLTSWLMVSFRLMQPLYLL